MVKEKESVGNLAERAYRQIRGMILNMELLPGQTILLEDLAQRLNMSRTPVRQAVERLSSGVEGLLKTVPRKGIVVSFPDAETMREIYEIMQGLEGQAVRLAVTRGPKEILVRMDESIRRQEEALGKNDRAGWAEADRDYHALLIDSSGNKKLRELVTMFLSQLNRTRTATLNLRSQEELEISTREHKELLEAIHKGDMEKALAIHARHRERTIKEMPKTVEHYLGIILHAGPVMQARGGLDGKVPE